jgi:hypothetical protein
VSSSSGHNQLAQHASMQYRHVCCCQHAACIHYKLCSS